MADDNRWLVVGLGNPEAEYGGTRHNIGADAVRAFARREHAELARNKRARCETAETTVAGTKFALAIPQSYINTSRRTGPAGRQLVQGPRRAHHRAPRRPRRGPRGIKVKRGGGPGGHNGLKDLDRALGSREYLRVRIGVGRPPGRMPGKDFVLRRFAPAERETIDVTVEEACDAVVMLATKGLEPTQNHYHRSR